MPPEREPLQPTPFEPATRSPEQPTAAPATSTSRSWLWPALGALVLVVLLVLFWLPQQIGPVQPSAPVAQGEAGTATGGAQAPVKPPAGQGDSPWSDAQHAKLRREAKDVLENLLEVQYDLKERSVEQWAGEAYADALAAAEQGDTQYRDDQLVEAKASYQSALDKLQAIASDAPAAMDRQMALVRKAIEEGDSDAAGQALAVAEKIEPENAELPALRQRVEALPQLLALLEQAQQAEAAGDLAGAQKALQQAVALDANNTTAAAELERVGKAYGEQQFSQAMSAGYQSMDGGDYAAARKQFNRAAGLQPGSTEASSALAELAMAEQSGRLEQLKRKGAKQVQDEQWQDAVGVYQQALKLDGSVVFAREGLQQAQQRAALDKGLQEIIEKPERLSDVAVAEAAGKLLQQAQSVSAAGPRLQKQVADVSRLLQRANTIVPVTLRSDGLTEVIIYKVARLGVFQEREVDMRPGSYKVRGSRVGYRDVLVTLEVSADGSPPPLTVACTEKIL